MRLLISKDYAISHAADDCRTRPPTNQLLAGRETMRLAKIQQQIVVLPLGPFEEDRAAAGRTTKRALSIDERTFCAPS